MLGYLLISWMLVRFLPHDWVVWGQDCWRSQLCKRNRNLWTIPVMMIILAWSVVELGLFAYLVGRVVRIF